MVVSQVQIERHRKRRRVSETISGELRERYRDTERERETERERGRKMMCRRMNLDSAKTVNCRKRRRMGFDSEYRKTQNTTAEKGSMNHQTEGKRSSTSLANSHSATTPPASFEDQMSPEQALRAAFLKTRFADIISKATHSMQQSFHKDHLTERQEIQAQISAEPASPKRREQLNSQRRLKIEAQIAAEAASQKRREQLNSQRRLKIEAQIAAEAASRKRREQLNRQRKAERIALQNMRKTSDDSITKKDMEMLGLRSGYPNSNILHKLGLQLREIY